MKPVFLNLFLAVLTISCCAQDGVSWQIKHDTKKVFSATEENENANTFSITLPDLTEKGCFTISYHEMNTGSRGKWIRTIAVYDQKDNELLKKQSPSMKVTDAQMKKMLSENKTIKIYTWALPKDPEEAARIRIRRVHLCTIVLR